MANNIILPTTASNTPVLQQCYLINIVPRPPHQRQHEAKRRSYTNSTCMKTHYHCPPSIPRKYPNIHQVKLGADAQSHATRSRQDNQDARLPS